MRTRTLQEAGAFVLYQSLTKFKRNHKYDTWDGRPVMSVNYFLFSD